MKSGEMSNSQTTALADLSQSLACPMNLLRLTDKGLYCPAGGFYIDPWTRVDRALVTHAHSDHAVPGSRNYLACQAGEHILTKRLGPMGRKSFLRYGESKTVNGVRVSFHPAGHVLGSSQIRLEYRGHVWVVTGDYKLQSDPTCAPFEPIRCDVLVSETTFGLPVFQWPEPRQVFDEINEWWQENQKCGMASILYAYALGKAQRILSGVQNEIGPIFVHGAIHQINQGYAKDGVQLPSTQYTGKLSVKPDWTQALIVAVPSAQGTPWMRRFGPSRTAMASGWMQLRGTRRRRSVDRGFVLSDHVDWPDLLKAISASQASEVWLTHGYTDHVSRYLQEKGYETRTLETRFRGETVDEDGDLEQASENAPRKEPPVQGEMT